MIKTKKIGTRFYLFSNIVLLFGISFSLFLYFRFSYQETSTGLYFRKITTGKGKSIEKFLEELSKEENEEKSKNNEKNVEKKNKNRKVILRIEKAVYYKGDILEYPGSSLNNLLLLEYEDVKNNNYCCDLVECVSFLKNIGDKYLFKIKAKDIGMNGVKDIRPDDYVCIELELVDIFTSDKILEKYFGCYGEFIQKSTNQLKKEKELICRYLNNIGRDYKNIGDCYITIDDIGRGEYIKNGDTVKFNFSIKKHGGNIVETNIKDVAIANDIYSKKKKYEPAEYVVNLNNRSPLQCLKFLKKGGQGKIYYPISTFGNIGEISFYEMDFEVLSVKIAVDSDIKKNGLKNIKKKSSKSVSKEDIKRKSSTELRDNVNSKNRDINITENVENNVDDSENHSKNDDKLDKVVDNDEVVDNNELNKNIQNDDKSTIINEEKDKSINDLSDSIKDDSIDDFNNDDKKTSATNVIEDNKIDEEERIRLENEKKAREKAEREEQKRLEEERKKQ